MLDIVDEGNLFQRFKGIKIAVIDTFIIRPLEFYPHVHHVFSIIPLYFDGVAHFDQEFLDAFHQYIFVSTNFYV